MQLVNTKYFKYIGVRIIYKDFSIVDKEIDHRIGGARGSFT